MRLYFAPGACSLSPHIVLREAGLSFDLVKVDLKNKRTALGENYVEINPKGYVPTLVLDNGETLTEGPAIVQYLADLVPEKNLAPPNGTLARYRLIEWLNYISTEIHKTFSPLFNDQTPEAYRGMVLEAIRKKFNFLEEHFKQNPFILGDHFSVADAYLFTLLRWPDFMKIDLSAWPHLLKYRERVHARPAVQEALTAEKAT